MIIGINALYLIPGRVGGSEVYLRRLLAALAELDREDEYIIFTSRESRGSLSPAPNFREYACPVRSLVRPARIAYEQLILPFLARKLRLDLLHSPGSVSSLLLPCPSVVTILDLIYLSFPETFPLPARMAMKFLVARSARRSEAVIALTEYSRGEILWNFDLPTDRVTVIPLGADVEKGEDTGGEEILKKHGIISPYLLCVSAAHAHKNLFRVLEAFYRLPPGDYRLVIMGVNHNRYFQQLLQMTDRLGLNDRVVFTGWVSEEEKGFIYRSSDLMVYASLLEGFGLPVVEAMSAGVPVACSDVPSLAEVAGEAAYLFNPYSVPEITRALETCLNNNSLRRELIRKGKKHAAGFTWPETARRTLALYREVGGKNK